MDKPEELLLPVAPIAPHATTNGSVREKDKYFRVVSVDGRAFPLTFLGLSPPTPVDGL